MLALTWHLLCECHCGSVARVQSKCNFLHLYHAESPFWPHLNSCLCSVPDPPQRFQVEGRSNQGEFRIDVCQTAQQEPPCPQLLFKDAEGGFTQLLTSGIQAVRLCFTLSSTLPEVGRKERELLAVIRLEGWVVSVDAKESWIVI